MGHILNIGDTVVGLDLKNSNVNNQDLEQMNTDKIPDVVLVKKVYADKTLRNRRRRWRLKHMEGFPHMDTESCNDEYNDFAADLEEDPTMRQYVNIYKDTTKVPVDEDDDDADCPKISLAEMLEDLDIGLEDATGEEGGEMLE